MCSPLCTSAFHQCTTVSFSRPNTMGPAAASSCRISGSPSHRLWHVTPWNSLLLWVVVISLQSSFLSLSLSLSLCLVHAHSLPILWHLFQLYPLKDRACWVVYYNTIQKQPFKSSPAARWKPEPGSVLMATFLTASQDQIVLPMVTDFCSGVTSHLAALVSWIFQASSTRKRSVLAQSRLVFANGQTFAVAPVPWKLFAAEQILWQRTSSGK